MSGDSIRRRKCIKPDCGIIFGLFITLLHLYANYIFFYLKIFGFWFFVLKISSCFKAIDFKSQAVGNSEFCLSTSSLVYFSGYKTTDYGYITSFIWQNLSKLQKKKTFFVSQKNFSLPSASVIYSSTV